MTDQRSGARTKALTPTSAAGGSLAAVVAAASVFVAGWEGLRQDPYRDLAGIRTVCYGETSGVENRRYSKAECADLLTRSLTNHARPILACLPASAPVPVKVAFVSFGYNVGSKAACGSIAARKARAGDYAGACRSLTNWVYVRGKRVQGLVNRRAAERDLCLKGIA